MQSACPLLTSRPRRNGTFSLGAVPTSKSDHLSVSWTGLVGLNVLFTEVGAGRSRFLYRSSVTSFLSYSTPKFSLYTPLRGLRRPILSAPNVLNGTLKEPSQTPSSSFLFSFFKIHESIYLSRLVLGNSPSRTFQNSCIPDQLRFQQCRLPCIRAHRWYASKETSARQSLMHAR